MKRIGYSSLATAILAIGLLTSALALAGDGIHCPGTTPNPNGALLMTRYFNDCPTTTLTTTNSYPALIQISDLNDDCFGGANRHLWKFSEDGGATKATFENCSNYHFCADVTLDGTANCEAGIEISPWWSDGDGQFMINGTTGEIACFGGRLPFYSFTGAYGLHYVLGSTVKMEMTYTPNGVNYLSPATVEYKITIAGTPYSSGPLAFDSGNPNEVAAHGAWGALYPHSVGGYMQLGGGNGVLKGAVASWANICYDNIGIVPTHTTSWGSLKTIYR